MKKLFIIMVVAFMAVSSAFAQNCKVQGIVQYYYNDYIGYKADIGAEVMFIKYSSALKIPNRQKWETYQGLVDKWIKAAYYRKYYTVEKACDMAGYKLEDKDTIQALGAELFAERIDIVDNDLVKYTTIVDASGMYEITVPYGIYYVLIKSKNRKLPTVLELSNRYQMIRVDLKSSTKIISYDFDIVRNNLYE